MTYARRTKVPVSRSRAEVEQLLTRAGARRITTGLMEDRAIVAFVLGDRVIKFELRLDDCPQERLRQLDSHIREKWRALLLAIKSKLVSVEAGVETLDEAFLAHVVTENGQTVAQSVMPRLAEFYRRGLPPMLGVGDATE